MADKSKHAGGGSAEEEEEADEGFAMPTGSVCGFDSILKMYLMCSGLGDLLPKFKQMNSEKTIVLGTFPKQCYSFARYMAESEKTGFYAEGYAKVPTVLFMPIWHA